MDSVLVTGTNRGLGLEFTRQFADDDWRVYACCRNPAKAKELNGIAGRSDGRVTVHPLEVTDQAQIDALAGEMDGVAIDVLISNAGIIGAATDADLDSFGHIDYARWAEMFEVNTMAPMRMAQAFVDHVARSDRKLMVFVSTRMASIGQMAEAGLYPYRSTKAALNAVVKGLSIDLKGRSIAVIAFHPGWVQTDMGGPTAPLSPKESVAGMRTVIERVGIADTGRFIGYDGSPIPW